MADKRLRHKTQEITQSVKNKMKISISLDTIPKSTRIKTKKKAIRHIKHLHGGAEPQLVRHLA